MTKKLPLRMAAAALTAGVALSLSAPAFAANPAPVEGSVKASNIAGDASFGFGYNNVINGHAAASRNMVIEGLDTVAVYCVQEGIDFNSSMDVEFNALTWGASGVGQPAKAAGIAVNSATIGTPLSDARSEGAAVQLAVWKYSSNLDFSSVANAEIRNRANQLVDNAPDAKEGISSFVLSGDAALDGANNVVTAKLVGNGSPLANSPIVLDLPGDNDPTANTDANGVATFTVPATDAKLEGTLRYSGVLEKGSILSPTDGQIVVTVSDARITRTAPVALAPLAPVVEEPPVVEEVAPPVVEEVAPPVVEEPVVVEEVAPPAVEAAPPVAEAVSDKPKELPYTGTWVTPTLAALAALAAGGGFFVRRYLANR